MNDSSTGGDAAARHLAQVQGLFIQHTPALRGFILGLVRDFALVDDVLQETFVQITAKAGDFTLGSSFSAWVHAIARFKVLEALRKQGDRAHRLSDEVIEALVACAPEDNDADQRLALLEQCLDGLAPKARQAIELRYAQAHKPAEIAQRIGWTVEAVYVALSRARSVLRDCVKHKLTGQELPSWELPS